MSENFEIKIEKQNVLYDIMMPFLGLIKINAGIEEIDDHLEKLKILNKYAKRVEYKSKDVDRVMLLETLIILILILHKLGE